MDAVKQQVNTRTAFSIHILQESIAQSAGSACSSVAGPLAGITSGSSSLNNADSDNADAFFLALGFSFAAAVELMPDADRELPYDGAKEMILVDAVDNREFLCKLVESMWEELPDRKKKKTAGS